MQSLAMTEGPLWQALRQAWQTVFLPDRCYWPLQTPEPVMFSAVANLYISGQFNGMILLIYDFQPCYEQTVEQHA